MGRCVIAGRAESQDGSVTAGSVSVQDSASEAGHSTAPQSYIGEHLNSRHRHPARLGTAYSEAGSTDAASVQTVRGSEATLGDVAEALRTDNQEVGLKKDQLYLYSLVYILDMDCLYWLSQGHAVMVCCFRSQATSNWVFSRLSAMCLRAGG